MRKKKELNIQLGEQIKRARETAKMTQEQLAERLELSPQYISDVERGVVGLTVETLKKICVILCVSSDQLLFAESPKSNVSALLERCSVLAPEHFPLLSRMVDTFVEAILTERANGRTGE